MLRLVMASNFPGSTSRPCTTRKSGRSVRPTSSRPRTIRFTVPPLLRRGFVRIVTNSTEHCGCPFASRAIPGSESTADLVRRSLPQHDQVQFVSRDPQRVLQSIRQAKAKHRGPHNQPRTNHSPQRRQPSHPKVSQIVSGRNHVSRPPALSSNCLTVTLTPPGPENPADHSTTHQTAH